mmetsp:Transcript_128519/g.399956  ORF Transcript_128519/g.399956 Transcript_128519/m.399956 type:complete len:571 (-) Transcript_128519:412-2124(-)
MTAAQFGVARHRLVIDSSGSAALNPGRVLGVEVVAVVASDEHGVVAERRGAEGPHGHLLGEDGHGVPPGTTRRASLVVVGTSANHVARTGEVRQRLAARARHCLDRISRHLVVGVGIHQGLEADEMDHPAVWRGNLQDSIVVGNDESHEWLGAPDVVAEVLLLDSPDALFHGVVEAIAVRIKADHAALRGRVRCPCKEERFPPRDCRVKYRRDAANAADSLIHRGTVVLGHIKDLGPRRIGTIVAPLDVGGGGEVEPRIADGEAQGAGLHEATLRGGREVRPHWRGRTVPPADDAVHAGAQEEAVRLGDPVLVEEERARGQVVRVERPAPPVGRIHPLLEVVVALDDVALALSLHVHVEPPHERLDRRGERLAVLVSGPPHGPQALDAPSVGGYGGLDDPLAQGAVQPGDFCRAEGSDVLPVPRSGEELPLVRVEVDNLRARKSRVASRVGRVPAVHVRPPSIWGREHAHLPEPDELGVGLLRGPNCEVPGRLVEYVGPPHVVAPRLDTGLVPRNPCFHVLGTTDLDGSICLALTDTPVDGEGVDQVRPAEINDPDFRAAPSIIGLVGHF